VSVVSATAHELRHQVLRIGRAAAVAGYHQLAPGLHRVGSPRRSLGQLGMDGAVALYGLRHGYPFGQHLAHPIRHRSLHTFAPPAVNWPLHHMPTSLLACSARPHCLSV